MNKYLLYVLIFIFGIIFVYMLILKGDHYKFSETKEFVFLSDIEALSFKIYKTGDYASTLVMFKYLDDKLKTCAIESKDSALFKNFKIDRGILHGRLYMLYKTRNEENLALDEYNNAIQLLGDDYNISSENELKNIITKMDNLKK
jgi:hypothetical protein